MGYVDRTCLNKGMPGKQFLHLLNLELRHTCITGLFSTRNSVKTGMISFLSLQLSTDTISIGSEEVFV